MTPENTQATPAQQPEKKITREQRRYQERVSTESKQVYSQLAKKFEDYLITCDDPEGQDTIDRVKQISAQWRLFCRRKNLIPSAYTIIDEFCDETLKEYLKVKQESAFIKKEDSAEMFKDLEEIGLPEHNANCPA